MMTILGEIESTDLHWSVVLPAVSLAVLGSVLMLCRRHQLRGTTLMPTWGWALFSLWAVAGAAMLGGLAVDAAASPWRDPLRLIAAATTFCPGIATMGARRPHLGVWQFVVFSLWGILVLPAIGTLVLHPDLPLEVHRVRQWFMLLLVVVAAVNILPTRHWPSALFLAAGQIALLAKHLPLSHPWLVVHGELLGLALCVAAVALAARGCPAQRKSVTTMDRLWLDFRDLFGMVWAMRVAEAVNKLSKKNDWKLTLTWDGFRESENPDATRPVPPELLLPLRPYLENLLRRFVSSSWIAVRLEEDVD